MHTHTHGERKREKERGNILISIFRWDINFILFFAFRFTLSLTLSDMLYISHIRLADLKIHWKIKRRKKKKKENSWLHLER